VAIISQVKGGPRVVRASAALPGAGVYDTEASAVALAVDVRGSRGVELFVDYTRGGAGGAFKVKVLGYNDDPAPAAGGGYERTIIDGASLSSGAVNVFTAEFKFPVTAGAALEKRSLEFLVERVAYVVFLFAEYGNTGSARHARRRGRRLALTSHPDDDPHPARPRPRPAQHARRARGLRPARERAARADRRAAGHARRLDARSRSRRSRGFAATRPTWRRSTPGTSRRGRTSPATAGR
jgi:hypothetical protein